LRLPCRSLELVSLTHGFLETRS